MQRSRKPGFRHYVFSETCMQLRICIPGFPIRQERATTMASASQRGHLVPIVASLSGIHSRVPRSGAFVDGECWRDEFDRCPKS